MTAPAAQLSPVADLFNALVRHLNRGLRAHIADLQPLLDDVRNRNIALRTARDFVDSDRAGYIDRTGLEAR